MSIVHTIEIQDSSGATKATIDNEGDNIELRAESTLSIDIDDEGVVVLSSGIQTGDDPYYIQKYKDVIEGGDIPGDYDFTGWNNNAVYKYISAIRGVQGTADRSFFLLGAGCSQIGLFDDGDYPGGNSGLTPSGLNNLNIINPEDPGLHVFDMCVADVDCEDYMTFYNYMDIVKQQIDKQRSNIERPPTDRIGDPPEEGQGAIYGFGVFDQYISLLAYWNYMVLLLYLRSFVIDNGDGTFDIVLSYRNNEGDAENAQMDITIEEQLPDGTFESSDILITNMTYKFRPKSAGVSVTLTGVGTAAGSAVCDDTFKINARWMTVITVDTTTGTPGNFVHYSADYTNVPFETGTEGRFEIP